MTRCGRVTRSGTVLAYDPTSTLSALCVIVTVLPVPERQSLESLRLWSMIGCGTKGAGILSLGHLCYLYLFRFLLLTFTSSPVLDSLLESCWLQSVGIPLLSSIFDLVSYPSWVNLASFQFNSGGTTR